MTTTMKAMVALSYGTPAPMKLKKVAVPTLQPHQVLVRVHASSATQADVMMLSGKPYATRLMLGLRKPKHPIPGTGFAGQVVAVGSQVTRFSKGQKVFGETTLGFSTSAEYVTVGQDGVILEMPENMGYQEAATYCDGPITAYNFLKEIGQVKPGQKVLVNGAAGSLGSAAVQIANILGATVTGVCSTRNIGMVRALGAHKVVDYTQKDFTQSTERYHVVFDAVGKSSFGRARRVLTPTGQYLTPVLKLSALWASLYTRLWGKQKAVFAATGMHKDHVLRGMLQVLVGWFKAGHLQVVIDRQYPLEKLPEAYRYIATGHKKGNVVIAHE